MLKSANLRGWEVAIGLRRLGRVVSLSGWSGIPQGVQADATHWPPAVRICTILAICALDTVLSWLLQLSELLPSSSLELGCFALLISQR
jgi:hypothetical protein